MKKSLIALAVVGAFSGAAVAQSNVTMYGILDVNYMWQQGPTNVGTTAAPSVQQESVNAINGGHQSGNRWGVRGTEALGGGLSAIFALEAGFNIDSGTSGQGGRLFGRQAYAGLSGGWGSVVAGRLATFSSGTGDFDMIGRVDPFLTGFGLAGAEQHLPLDERAARGQRRRLCVADLCRLQGRSRLLDAHRWRRNCTERHQHQSDGLRRELGERPLLRGHHL